MRTHQWKTILVIANCIKGDIPAFDRVAAFAIRTELAAMNVGMAVGATCADVLENQAGVALCASHFLVHAA
jgi:hypothetical protein